MRSISFIHIADKPLPTVTLPVGILVCKVCKSEYTVEAGDCTNCQADMESRYHHFAPDN